MAGSPEAGCSTTTMSGARSCAPTFTVIVTSGTLTNVRYAGCSGDGNLNRWLAISAAAAACESRRVRSVRVRSRSIFSQRVLSILKEPSDAACNPLEVRLGHGCEADKPRRAEAIVVHAGGGGGIRTHGGCWPTTVFKTVSFSRSDTPPRHRHCSSAPVCDVRSPVRRAPRFSPVAPVESATVRIKRIHRLTLAVRDVNAARATFERLFGAAPADGAVQVPAFGIRALDLRIGEDTLQLAAPADADNPVMRFLERKGEGFYNLALEVDDLDAAVAELAAQGVRVSEPVEAEPGVRSAFVTMTATHGLSIQLVELLTPAHASEIPVAVRAEPDEPADAPPADAPAAEPPASPPLDLTPDEWSDVD